MLHRKSKKYIFLTILVTSLFIFSLGFSAVPNLINYQGRLKDGTGGALPDNTYLVTFAIYHNSSTGSPVWSESRDVVLEDGIFSVALGSINVIDGSIFNSDCFLGITVAGDSEMIPRQQLLTVPYAFVAGDAEQVDGLEAAALDQSAHLIDSGNPHAVTAAQVGAITGVSAGTGLQGGGTSGDVVLSANTSYIQQRVSGSCLAGSSIRLISHDGSVLCEADDNSGGDITSVTAGVGLEGGGTAGDVSLKVDESEFQRLVTGTCPAGSSIRAINSSGSVSCETDDIGGDGHSLDAVDGIPADAVYVDGFGRMGVGTSAPHAETEIRGTSPALRIASDQDQISRLQLYEMVGSTPYGFSFDYDGNNNEMYLWTTGLPSIEKIRMAWERNSGEIGIGTIDPTELLHIENSEDDGRAFLKIESSHVTNWNEAGLRIETPQNMWHLRMDDDTNNNLGVGALGLRSQDTGMEVMVWQESGRVGIGTTDPDTRLEINGNGSSWRDGFLAIKNLNNDAGIRLYDSDTTVRHHIFNDDTGNWDDTLRITSAGSYTSGGISISQSGNVGIGTTTPNNRLDVAGTIRAEEIIVDSGWADFVLDDDYDLMKLEDVESFIRKRGHLPDIPSEAEVAGRGGIGLGEFQVKLLQKVEELTLHLIEQNRQITRLHATIENMRRDRRSSTN